MTLIESTIIGLSGVSLAVIAWEQHRRARDWQRVNARRIDILEDRLNRLESRAAVQSPPPSTPTSRVHLPAQNAPTLISVPNLAPVAAPGASAEAVATWGRRYAAVWELADAGKSAEAIARATGQPVGQVELILGLRRERPEPRRPRPA
jgi:hypothetical protein